MSLALVVFLILSFGIVFSLYYLFFIVRLFCLFGKRGKQKEKEEDEDIGKEEEVKIVEDRRAQRGGIVQRVAARR